MSDGNYRAVRDLLWRRANVIVFNDLPKRQVMARLLRRTIRRGASREELWNGNREMLRHLISWNREINVVLWSWGTHARYTNAGSSGRGHGLEQSDDGHFISPATGAP